MLILLWKMEVRITDLKRRKDFPLHFDIREVDWVSGGRSSGLREEWLSGYLLHKDFKESGAISYLNMGPWIILSIHHRWHSSLRDSFLVWVKKTSVFWTIATERTSRKWITFRYFWETLYKGRNFFYYYYFLFLWTCLSYH